MPALPAWWSGIALTVARLTALPDHTGMMLARISPDGAGAELRSFECPTCAFTHVATVPVAVKGAPRTLDEG